MRKTIGKREENGRKNGGNFDKKKERKKEGKKDSKRKAEPKSIESRSSAPPVIRGDFGALKTELFSNIGPRWALRDLLDQF